MNNFQKTITVGSFFAGVGGIDLGFKQAGFDIVYANEFDSSPVCTYEANSCLKVDVRDIADVKACEIPSFDIMVGGFPCQAFSIAGYRQGFKDWCGRGTLFFEMVRLIRERKEMNDQPKIIFLENVKNLVGHNHGETFRVILNCLEELGYHVKFKVLNAKDYNVPQNRERVYIIAFLDEEAYNMFKFPSSITSKCNISEVIDFSGEFDEKFYYTDKCKFYNILTKEMLYTDVVYQWRRVYVRENKSGCIPTLTANMGTGGHNVPLIKTKDGRIRKLTPRECFNAQGFPPDFVLPSIANSKLYKQAGNSVVVPVISLLAKAIRDVIV